MIRINLLPKQKRVQVSNVEKELALFFLLLVLIGIGVGFLHNWMSGQVGKLEVEYAQKEAEKLDLTKKVARVTKISSELTDLKAKVEIIKDIRLKQGLPVKYIDEMVSNLPAEKIWFEAFNIDSGGGISIRGVAIDNQAFALYVRNLRSSPYIASVVTQRTSKRDIQGYGLVEFTCNITAKPASAEKNNG